MLPLLVFNATASDSSGEIGSLVLRAGDLLALATGPDFHARKNLRRNFLVLNDNVDVRLLDQTQAISLSGAVVGDLPCRSGNSFSSAWVYCFCCCSCGQLDT